MLTYCLLRKRSIVFGISTSELVVILIVALIVLGPKRLPEVAKTIAKVVRELRSAMDDLKANVEKEEVFRDAKNAINVAKNTIQDPAREIAKTITEDKPPPPKEPESPNK